MTAEIRSFWRNLSFLLQDFSVITAEGKTMIKMLLVSLPSGWLLLILSVDIPFSQ